MTAPTVNFPLLFGPPSNYYSQSNPGPYCTISGTQYLLSIPSGVKMNWGSPGEMNVFEEYNFNFNTITITVNVSNIVAGTQVYLFRKAFDRWRNFIDQYYISRQLVNEINTLTVTSVNGQSGVAIEQIGIMVISPNSGNCTCDVISVSIIPMKPIIGTLDTQSPKTFGDLPYNLTDPSSTSPGTFSYSSSNVAVATMNGRTVTIVGEGTCTITATQSATPNYTSITTSSELLVKQITPTLTNFSIPQKNVDDPPFVITPPTSNSEGLFTYTSSNSAVATIISYPTLFNQFIIDNPPWGIYSPSDYSNNILHESRGNGRNAICSGISLRSGSGNGSNAIVSYLYGSNTSTIEWPAGSIPTTFTMCTISRYTGLNKQRIFNAKNANWLHGHWQGKTGLAHYNGWKTPTVNRIDPDTNWVVMCGKNSGAIPGNILVNGIPNGNDTGGSAVINDSLTINTRQNERSDFAISYVFIWDKALTDDEMNFVSSNLMSYLNIGTAGIAKINITGPGTSTITANQVPWGNYGSGSITTELIVNQTGQQTPTIGDLNITTPQTYAPGLTISIAQPSSTSDGAFTYTSSDTSVATISGINIAVLKVGTTIIRATQAETVNYTSGYVEKPIFITQATPTIGALSITSPIVYLPGSAFNLTNPTSNSTGAFSYSSSNLNIATIIGNTVTIVGAGICTITATQAETTNYTSGSTSAPLQVNQATPTITNFSIPTKTILDSSFAITQPNSNSTGAFSYSSSNGTVATVSGNIVTIIGLGETVITATQAETTNYTSGSIITIFHVIKATPTITNFSIPQYVLGDPSFQLTPPTSNNPEAFTYISSNPAAVTITDVTTVTIIALGTSTISAVQPGTDIFTSGIISGILVNPTPISSNEDLIAFIASSQTYGQLSNDLIIQQSLTASLSNKYLINNSTNFIKIVKNFPL